MSTTLWWIRRDLRLADNQALHAALAHGEQVAPVFILDPALLASPFTDARRIAFLFDGLRKLDADLRTLGSRLIVRRGRPEQELARLCQEAGANAVYAEGDHSPYARQRDAAVLAAGVPLQLVGSSTARPVEEVLKEDGAPYTVYTPFSRRWKAAPPIRPSDLLPRPARIITPAHLMSDAVPAEPALPADTPWPAGETEAQSRLERFTEGAHFPIYGYANERNRPDLDATSGLSPYLRFGMLSPRAAACVAYAALEQAPTADARASAETWLNELVWREFYIAILHHFPHVRAGSFRPEYDRIQWRNDEDEFAAWREGRTGYPMVDAAMRQLLATGWMHNRTRMVAASFLVKDLLIDWRWGEEWFMQQLLDGDPASNNGGWQWTAGTGTDAAPYFRIFNPVSQGVKFDPDGVYVRRWVPELRQVPGEFVHEPWTLPKSEQVRSRCVIGVDYPLPLVDHAFARERTLAAYAQVREI